MTRDGAFNKAERESKEKGVTVGVVEFPKGYYAAIPEPFLSLEERTLEKSGCTITKINP